jgi:hypothetical protein
MKLSTEQLADAVVDTIKKTVDGPLVAGRIAALEHRIKELEAKPSVKFAGPFQGGKSYEVGDMVQHQNALWICMAPTSGTPSKDFVGWKMALKKGDAR